MQRIDKMFQFYNIKFRFQLIIKMFDFFGCMGSNPTAGSFAYQVFNKVPKIPIGGLAQFIQAGSIQQLIGGINDLNKYTKNFNNTGGFGNINNIPNIGTFGNLGSLGNIISIAQDKGVLDLSVFINNIPQQSVRSTDGNLKDLISSHQNEVIKKILKSNYNELIKKYKQKGGKWTDHDFPPDESSIGKSEQLPVKVTWRRIPEVVKNAVFVQGRIQPSDIFQGSIGDCYFLSAISSLSQNQFRIKNLFPSLQMNEHGIYMARILYNGVIRQVVVDDYIPVTPQNTPLFAKPAAGSQIWVMILQKCWAKLHGSYSAIKGGQANQVLHAFSGAPTFHYSINADQNQQQKIWSQIFKAFKQSGLLCCGTKSSTSVQNSGLVLGHAYTILNLYQKPVRLMKLRNPWGKRQWTGRASEQDVQFWSKISPTDKQTMGFKQANDGVFFMLWEDFVNYFSFVDICKINDNANYLSLDFLIRKKRGQIFQFQFTQPGKVIIGLSQQPQRGQKLQFQRGYSRATLVVAQYDNNASKGHEYKYIGSYSSRKFSQLALQLANLEPAKYIAFAKIDWISVDQQMAAISIYSEPKATLKKSKQSSHDKFLFTTFLDHARKNPKKQILNQSPQQWFCSQILLNEGGYGYLAFHVDENSKRKLGVEINEKQFTDKRIVMKKPYKGQGTIKLMVQAGKQLIILFRLKSQNYPNTLTLPKPKIFNLV